MLTGQRYVIGLNENGQSSLLMTGLPNAQEKENFFWQATLWKTRETPVDNSIPGDRSLDGGAARSPFSNGMLVRSVELWPDPDPETQRRQFAELNEMVGHTQQITEAQQQRSLTMHRTDTLDVITVLRGEIYCLLDDTEILLKPFDTVILQGVNHGWSNRGTEPCLMIGCMIDALPRH
jgi:quercetin dioxygenase-like cupin family protein